MVDKEPICGTFIHFCSLKLKNRWVGPWVVGVAGGFSGLVSKAVDWGGEGVREEWCMWWWGALGCVVGGRGLGK